MTDQTKHTDRELLTLAAKAAGITLIHWSDTARAFEILAGDRCYWNPLTDDGDALRLAVKLGIQVGDFHQYGKALAYHGATRGAGEFWEVGEPFAATRRAIVRAAAEIGSAA